MADFLATFACDFCRQILRVTDVRASKIVEAASTTTSGTDNAEIRHHNPRSKTSE
ncbi:hypothetical protein EDD90_2792 [Streptomyces sp. Ag109_O5-1]|nr:hypothetical protein EDD90_2792 [Streptomyces sp. Ag109_O5-1]